MSIIPRANPANVQTDLVGINARNETRVSFAAADAIGQATRGIQEGLGAAAHVAQQAQDRADVQSYLDARNKIEVWRSNWMDPNNGDGFHAYKGKDALGLRDKILPDFDKTAGEISSSLSPRARLKFQEYAQSRRQDVYDQVNTYALGQYQGWEAANQNAFEVNSANSIVESYLAGNIDQAMKLKASALEAIYADESTRGGPAEESAMRVGAYLSRIHATVLDRLLVTDPIRAKAYFDANQSGLLPDVRAVAEAKVRTYADDAQAEQSADNAMSGAVAPSENEVQAHLGALGESHGFQTTSTIRTPEENAKVGGVPNSQHLTGAARDFSVKGKTVEQINAFVSALRADGYEVISRDHGTGPHIHAELPPGATAAGKKPAETLGQGIAALRNDPALNTPQLRRAAEAKLRSKWATAEADKIDARNNATERAFLAIETKDPSLPLRTILGADFEPMAAAGHIPNLERRLAERRTGATVASDPVTLAALEEGIYRAKAGGEAAMAGLRAINPYDPSLPLAPDDRRTLAKAKLDLLSGDAKRVARADTEGEVKLLIRQYRTVQLGLTDEVIAKNATKMREAIEFDQAMRTWRAKFAETEGRDPSYLEIQKQGDLLTLSRLPFKVPGVVYGTNEVKVAELGIPEEQQSQIVDALRSRGLPVTGQNVAEMWRAYLQQQAAK